MILILSDCLMAKAALVCLLIHLKSLTLLKNFLVIKTGFLRRKVRKNIVTFAELKNHARSGSARTVFGPLSHRVQTRIGRYWKSSAGFRPQ
jgi:hypothetical protein